MAESVLEKLLEATDVYLSKVLNRGNGSTLVSDEEMEGEDDVVITSQPSLIEGQMRSYQIEGLDWFAQLTRNGVNGILADEMGLGKTLQSISILALAKEREWKEDQFPHLIVCPKSTISNWEKEFKRFCPSFSTCCLIGSQEERQLTIEERIKTGDFKVLITSFDVCRIEISTLRKLRFGFFILDEAHRIKNEESVLSSIVRMVAAERIFLLTGTPLQNNLHELWAILNFIMPNIFDSSWDFDQIFQRIVTTAEDQEVVASTLHRILRPFMLRRLKADVAKDLPEKKEVYVYVGLSGLQRQIYKDIVLKNADSILNANNAVGKTRLVNTLMQLRKCCNHPYLFQGVEPGPPYREGAHLIENCGKLGVMDKLVDRILGENKRNQILIFSQMTRMLDILDDYCRFKSIPRSRIDGSTLSSDRQVFIDDFTREDSDKRIFLLSTRAGGLGINLTSANFVFIYDADFNPQSDLQAIDRAHRIGQRRPVTVYRFVSKNTVEEKIMESAARKMVMDKLVIRKSSETVGVSKEEIGNILQFGVSELFYSDEEKVEEDIDALLEFSEQKTNDFSQKMMKFSPFHLKFDHKTHGDGKNDPVKEEERQVVIPEEVRRAAAAVAGEVGEIILIGPRERKAIVPVAKPPLVVNKSKLAEWRGKVGGGHDYQLYDSKRLDELERKAASSLSRAEKGEQEKLLCEGFANFTRKSFHTVVRLLEEMGYSDLTVEAICKAIPERPREELERYVETLMRRGSKFLGNGFMSRLLGKVKQVEELSEKVNAQMESLSEKINEKDLKNVWLQLPVDSPFIDNNSPWTNQADRIVLCGLYYYGYDNASTWSNLKQLLCLHPSTCLNFPLLQLKLEDIKSRADELLEIVHEEFPSLGNNKINKKKNRVK